MYRARPVRLRGMLTLLLVSNLCPSPTMHSLLHFGTEELNGSELPQYWPRPQVGTRSDSQGVYGIRLQ